MAILELVPDYVCKGPGTCVPECHLYGKCHCGCGLATNLAPKANTARNWTRGRPYRCLIGHGTKPRNPAGQDKKGPAAEEYVWMLDAMHAEGMTNQAIGDLIGWNHTYVSQLRLRYNRYIQRSTARRIEDAYKKCGFDRPLRVLKVSATPLREYMETRGLTPNITWGYNHTWTRNYYRYDSYTLAVADEMAISLGVNPLAIWGDEFLEPTLMRRFVRRTHCAEGHRLTPENTRIERNGQRRCRTCDSRRKREYYRRGKASA